MESLKVYRRNEKVADVLCAISVIGFIVGSFSGVFSLFLKESLFGIIASGGFIICVLPFLFLQVLTSAGFKSCITKNVKYKFLYFVIFPAVDVIFFLGINGCFNLIPNFHLISREFLGLEVINDAMYNFLFYIIIIYFSLNITGFVILSFRMIERRIKL